MKFSKRACPKTWGCGARPRMFFFLFQFHLRQFPDLWRLFCGKNDQITEVLLQFLNPRCSAALKKAGPIVDKLDHKFWKILKILDFFFQISRFAGIRGATCLLWDPLFLARLRLGTASWIKEIKITIVN